MKRLYTLILGAAALAAAHGCTSDPALFLGGPPGPATQLKLSSSRTALIVGDSVVIGARAQDEVSNPTGDAVTLTACDAAVTVTGQSSSPEWSTTAFLKGAGLGSSCVVVQAAGLTDTIRVAVGPAGLRIVGPDTLLSGGDAGTYTIEAFDASGAALSGTTEYSFSSSNVARMAIDIPTGVAVGKSTGAVNVQVYAPGGANAVKSVTVVPGVFLGTLSTTSAAPGALVTATRASGAAAFDADVAVRLGATAGWVDLITADVLTFAVPATGSTAADVLSLLNMGPGQIAQTTAFTATKALDDVYGPANLVPAAGPDVDDVMSESGNIYTVTAGACAGGGGADCDDFFTITAGATDREVTVTLTWVNSAAATGDLDILWCDEACAAYVGNFDGAGSSKPEVSTVTIPANTTWRLWINNYAQAAGQFSNVRITLQ
jgi:hypothetical protein